MTKQIASCFTCPTCGHHQLDEVMIGVIQRTPIAAVGAISGGVACIYGDPATYDEGEVVHYSCGHCGAIVAENEDELATLLNLDDDTDLDQELCEKCGEELDRDCQGELRCPNCDPPCPGCSDGGGPGDSEMTPTNNDTD